MNFPKYKNKHLAEALFSPEEYINYAKIKKEIFPKKYIISYQENAENYFKKKFKGKYKIIPLSKRTRILKIGEVGFLRVKGIGAPYVVTIIEELIALGAKEFINVGSAGGLKKRGIFLCNKSVRDEGTSHHYLPNSIYSYPDKELTNRIKKQLEKNKLKYTLAPSWTIDAPYRETKKEIAHYKKKGIATVEMEASAVFAVTKLRKIKSAALFVVSDVLGEKWEPEFHTMNYKKTLNKMIDLSFLVLNKK